MNMKQENNKERVVYLDILRILACFFIGMVHVIAQHIMEIDITSFDFKIYSSYHCLAFSGVSIYIMISGALMLNSDKEISLRGIIKKVLHFYFLYVVWKFIYFIFDIIKYEKIIDRELLKDLFEEVVSGRGYYHLWFLPTISIIYLFIPLIKKSVENNKNLCIYYLILFFFAQIMLETLSNFNYRRKKIVDDFFSYNDFYLFTGYIGYYIYGHFLNKYEIKKFIRIAIYFLALISFCAVSFITIDLSGKDEYNLSMNQPFSLPSFVITTAVFLFIKNGKLINKPVFNSCIVRTISKLTLGIYLIHPMVLVLTEKIGFNTLLFCSALSILIVTFGLVTITGLLAYVIYKIPFVRRLII